MTMAQANASQRVDLDWQAQNQVSLDALAKKHSCIAAGPSQLLAVA